MISLSWDIQPTSVDYKDFVDIVKPYQVWYRRLGQIGQLSSTDYYVLVFDNIRVTRSKYVRGSSDINFRGGVFARWVVLGGSFPADIRPFTDDFSDIGVVVGENSGLIASDRDRSDKLAFIRNLTQEEIDHIRNQLEGV